MKPCSFIAPCVAMFLAAAPSLPPQGTLQEFTLPNGLRVCLLERHDNSVVRLRLELRWTEAGGLPGKEGAPALLAQALDAWGVGSLTRPEFSRSLAENGLRLAFRARRCAFSWDLATDSHAQESAFAHLADAVFRPAFEGPALEARRNALRARLRAMSPRERALADFRDRIASPEMPLPDAATLDVVELRDLERLHQRLVRPEKALLVLHGDLNLAQARQLALLHFGVWGPPADHEPPKALQPREAPQPISLEAAEVEIRVGTAGACPSPAREILALLVPRALAESRLGILLDPRGPLVLKAPKGQGEATLLAALDRLRKGFTQEELDRAKRLWRAQRMALPLHPALWTEATAEGWLGNPRDLEARVQALGLQECNTALRDWIAPGNLCWLRIGPAPGK